MEQRHFAGKHFRANLEEGSQTLVLNFKIRLPIDEVTPVSILKFELHAER